MITWLFHFFRNWRDEHQKTFGSTRSSEWSKVRKQHLKDHPACDACGGTKNLQVHHVRSFATHPELELQDSNFLVLCEGMERNCHRMIGHLNSYLSINETSREDAAYWLDKIQNRPTWDGKIWKYPNPSTGCPE